MTCPRLGVTRCVLIFNAAIKTSATVGRMNQSIFGNNLVDKVKELNLVKSFAAQVTKTPFLREEPPKAIRISKPTFRRQQWHN